MLENHSFSSHGFTLLYRLSPTSAKTEIPTPAVVEQLVAAGLAELSDQPDGKLDDIRVTREGYVAKFVPLQLPPCQITVLRARQGPTTRKTQSEAKMFGLFDDYGGCFERANFVGMFLVNVQSAERVNPKPPPPAAAAVAPAAAAVESSFAITPPTKTRVSSSTSSVGTRTSSSPTTKQPSMPSPTSDRKKQLYRSLFNEDEDMDPATDSSSKENAKTESKKKLESKDGKVETKKRDVETEKRSRKAKQGVLATDREVRRQAAPPADEPYSPSGSGGAEKDRVSGMAVTYRPHASGRSKKKNSPKIAEYVPEYVSSTSYAQPSTAGNGAMTEYVPSKLTMTSAPPSKVPEYVPQPTKASTGEGRATLSYKPGARRKLVDFPDLDGLHSSAISAAPPEEYEPIMPPGHSHPAYKPSAKRPNHRSDDTIRGTASATAYEPIGFGGETTGLQYKPSRAAKPTEVRKGDERLRLRPRSAHLTTPLSPPSHRHETSAEAAKRVSS